jgi:predicted Zn finger-like uncharacterized protein
MAVDREGSAIMVIECISCLRKFKLDERLLKPSGSKVRCTKCGNIFRAFPDFIRIGANGPERNAHAESAITGNESLLLDIERRKHPRVKISLPVSCVLEDSAGNPLDLLLGHITEVSQEGIVIELFNGPRSGMASLTFISHEDKEICIRGKVVHSEAGGAGKTKVGMSLRGTPQEVTHFVTQAVRAHHSVNKVESQRPPDTAVGASC